jgi:glycerol-1-phosphate dehydrogenase [NAD(P)+]
MLNEILKQHFNTIPAIVKIDSGLQDNIFDIVSEINLGKSFVIVSDENTYDILGKKAEKALSSFKTKSITLKPDIADDNSVEKVLSQIESYDAVIAVGSGTINDICKYSSYQANKPYIVFGTAPSMNGYSSANASITIKGHKKTLKAHLPKAILLDLDILSKSPKRLIKSGLGDSICRPTVQSDWLLSHFLLDTPYNQSPFDMLKPIEQDLFENSSGLINGDRDIIKLLATNLVLSGFGMYICQGSHPASQGEHMIAHTMEMAYPDLPHSFHGEQIAVTTIQMSKIIESKIQNAPTLQQKYSKQEILKFFGEKIGSQCLDEYRSKLLSNTKLDELNHKISTNWNDITNQIGKIYINKETLLKYLKNASVPTNPSDIKWNQEQFKIAVNLSKFTRNRFTFLDL